MEGNPHSGIDSRTWRIVPKVTLQIDGGKGEIVEERREVITTSFTPSSEEDEQAVLDETDLRKENV